LNKLTFETEGMSPVWTSDSLAKTTTLLNHKYFAFVEDEVFTIDALGNHEQVQLRMTLLKKDGSVKYPVEAVHLLEPESKYSKADLAFLMLDYLDNYWQEYFREDRDVYLSLDWSKHEFEGGAFFLRGFVRNVALEDAADALFLKYGHGEYEIEPISSEV
jgi:hypothetical protein